MDHGGNPEPCRVHQVGLDRVGESRYLSRRESRGAPDPRDLADAVPQDDVGAFGVEPRSVEQFVNIGTAELRQLLVA